MQIVLHFKEDFNQSSGSRIEEREGPILLQKLVQSSWNARSETGESNFSGNIIPNLNKKFFLSDFSMYRLKAIGILGYSLKF